MGSLFSIQYMDINENEWKQIARDPVMFQSLVDSAVIEITDVDNKIHKMTFRKGGILKFEKIEGKYRFYWDNTDLI